MRIAGDIATQHPFKLFDDTYSFDEKIIESMAKEAPGKPVYLEFQGDPVGVIDRALVVDTRMVINATLSRDVDGVDITEFYAVPDIIMEPKDGTNPVTFCEFRSAGLTRKPCDKALFPLTLIEP